MGNNISRLRSRAWQRQAGLCFYCQLPMLVGEPSEFCRRSGLTLRQARRCRCTAEHLVPRCEGGKNSKDNIVAACWLCNYGRHRRKKLPRPDEWRKKRSRWRRFQER